MIFKRKDGVTMEVCNDLQASAFRNSGDWEEVKEVPETIEETIESTPAKRGRKPVQASKE